MSLLDTLKALDPADDSLWTDDGLPALDAVKTLTGDTKISRKAINDVALGLTRANVLEYVAPPTQATPEAAVVEQPVVEEAPVDTSYQAAISHYQASMVAENELKMARVIALKSAGFTAEDALMAFPQLKRK